MKNKQEKKTHPVDEYFQQQSELLEIRYNPEHWQQLADELAVSAPAERQSDSNTESIQQASKPRKNYRFLIMLLIAIIASALFFFISTPKSAEAQLPEESSIGLATPKSPTPKSSQIKESTPQILSLEESTSSAPAYENANAQRHRAASQAVARLPRPALPQDLKPISLSPQKLPVPLDSSQQEHKEIFIYW